MRVGFLNRIMCSDLLDDGVVATLQKEPQESADCLKRKVGESLQGVDECELVPKHIIDQLVDFIKKTPLTLRKLLRQSIHTHSHGPSILR